MAEHLSMLDAIHQVCTRWKQEHGDEPIPASWIREQVEDLRQQKPGAGLPADGCYNRVNAPTERDNKPVFEYVARGLYRYLGPNYRYTGFILHCDKNGQERIIGRWEDGQREWYGESGPLLPARSLEHGTNPALGQGS